MVAIDTNVVVRFVTRDDPDQSPRARALVESTDVVVSVTVILESAWVLASRYRYSAEQVARALTAFVGMPRVTAEHAAALDQALDWIAAGLDFADALHLAQARDHDGFATFDRKLASSARRLGDTPIRLL